MRFVPFSSIARPIDDQVALLTSLQYTEQRGFTRLLTPHDGKQGLVFIRHSPCFDARSYLKILGLRHGIRLISFPT
jgi:hypothetical protein